MCCVRTGSRAGSPLLTRWRGLTRSWSRIARSSRFYNSPSRPVSFQTEKLITASVIVLQLSINESSQICNTVCFCLLDILHAPEDVLAGFFIFGFLGPKFLLDSKILPLGFLHLGERSIVGKSAVFELLPGSLQGLVVVPTQRETTYLIFLHHGQ